MQHWRVFLPRIIRGRAAARQFLRDWKILVIEINHLGGVSCWSFCTLGGGSSAFSLGGKVYPWWFTASPGPQLIMPGSLNPGFLRISYQLLIFYTGCWSYCHTNWPCLLVFNRKSTWMMSTCFLHLTIHIPHVSCWKIWNFHKIR